jgi:nucleotide-binding universal stress UspA family protein
VAILPEVQSLLETDTRQGLSASEAAAVGPLARDEGPRRSTAIFAELQSARGWRGRLVLMERSGDVRERVVVGVDGSPASLRALDWAVRYAERTGASIKAVHAWQIPTTYGAPVAVLGSEDFGEAAARALRGSVAEVLGQRVDVDVEPVTEMGYPSRLLVEHSKRADLLVVGSRGHGGLMGTLLGSVSLH